MCTSFFQKLNKSPIKRLYCQAHMIMLGLRLLLPLLDIRLYTTGVYLYTYTSIQSIHLYNLYTYTLDIRLFTTEYYL